MNSVTGPTQTNPSETNTTSTNSNATVPKLADAELVKTIEAQGTNEPINWGLFVEKLAGTVAAICLAISLCVAWRGWGQPFDPHKMPWPHIRILQACIVVTWIIIPPMWFWLDYFFIYLRNHKMGDEPPPDIDLFKYGQDISSKIWIAVSTALLALYFGSTFGK